MSKKCHHCGLVNDDEMYFCHACGEPLSKDLKLLMELEEIVNHPHHQSNQPPRRRMDDDDYDYVRHKTPQKEEKHYHWFKVLLILVIVGALIWFFLR